MPGPDLPQIIDPPGVEAGELGESPYPTTSVNPAVQSLVDQILEEQNGSPDPDFPELCPGGIPCEQGGF
jgi:hypothetical protein